MHWPRLKAAIVAISFFWCSKRSKTPRIGLIWSDRKRCRTSGSGSIAMALKRVVALSIQRISQRTKRRLKFILADQQEAARHKAGSESRAKLQITSMTKPCWLAIHKRSALCTGTKRACILTQLCLHSTRYVSIVSNERDQSSTNRFFQLVCF